MSRLIQDAIDDSSRLHQPTPISQEQMLKDELALHHDIIAMEEAQFSLEKEDLRIESLMDAVTTLESINDDLCTHQDLTQHQFYGYALAMESLHPSLGPITNIHIGSNESVSLERESSNIIENIQKLWKQIKKGIRAAIDRVMDFFHRLFKGLKRFHKNVQNTRSKITELRRGAAKASVSTFETNTVQKLYMNGNLTIPDLKDGMVFLEQSVYGRTGEISGAIDFYYETLSNMFEGKGSNYDAIKAYIDNLVQNGYIFNASPELRKASLFEGGNRDTEQEIFQLFDLVALPGGKQIVIGVLKKKASTESFYALTAPRVVDANQLEEVVEEPDSQEAPLPSLEQMDVLLEGVETLIGKMQDHEKMREGLTEKRKKLVEIIGKKMDEQNEEASGVEKYLNKKLISLVVRQMQKDHVAGLSRIDRYVFTYIRTMHRFVQQGMGYYEPGQRSDSKAMVTV